VQCVVVFVVVNTLVAPQSCSFADNGRTRTPTRTRQEEEQEGESLLVVPFMLVTVDLVWTVSTISILDTDGCLFLGYGSRRRYSFGSFPFIIVQSTIKLRTCFSVAGSLVVANGRRMKAIRTTGIFVESSRDSPHTVWKKKNRTKKTLRTWCKLLKNYPKLTWPTQNLFIWKWKCMTK
jgi:hypothetical protein